MSFTCFMSFPRRRESISLQYEWIPAYAGMTIVDGLCCAWCSLNQHIIQYASIAALHSPCLARVRYVSR